MTKTELEAFLAVLQYGSISAAAERLFITQPAMSRRMKSMEEELGYSLFERGRGQRSVELTENGKEFVPVAERLLTLYREAEEIPRRKKSPLLRVSTVNSIAFYLMPAVLKEMMSARDTCSIEFKTGRSSDIYGYVENGSVDVALVSDLLNSRRIVPFPVFREPFVFAGGESWRETGRVTPDMLDPEEQIRLPWNPDAQGEDPEGKDGISGILSEWKKMGGDPASCCKAIQETRRVDLSDGRRTGGHDDLWTHKREPDG